MTYGNEALRKVCVVDVSTFAPSDLHLGGKVCRQRGVQTDRQILKRLFHVILKIGFNDFAARKIHRQRDRESEGQKYRKTERQRDRESERQSERERERDSESECEHIRKIFYTDVATSIQSRDELVQC